MHLNRIVNEGCRKGSSVNSNHKLFHRNAFVVIGLLAVEVAVGIWFVIGARLPGEPRLTSTPTHAALYFYGGCPLGILCDLPTHALCIPKPKKDVTDAIQDDMYFCVASPDAA